MFASLEQRKALFSPVLEIAAYELIWQRQKTVAKVAKLFQDQYHRLPSEVAESFGIGTRDISWMKERLNELLPFRFYSALFHGDFEYPQKLRDAKHPIEVLYYRGRSRFTIFPLCFSCRGT